MILLTKAAPRQRSKLRGLPCLPDADDVRGRKLYATRLSGVGPANQLAVNRVGLVTQRRCLFRSVEVGTDQRKVSGLVRGLDREDHLALGPGSGDRIGFDPGNVDEGKIAAEALGAFCDPLRLRRAIGL